MEARSVFHAPGTSGRRRADAYRPTPAQINWLKRGLGRRDGKLPLFDQYGQRVSERTVQSCIDHGWAEPSFDDAAAAWVMCQLTEPGRVLAAHR